MTELTVSLDRTGIVVEIEQVEMVYLAPDHVFKNPRHTLLGATLSPDEARDIASQLNEQADLFEANAFEDADDAHDLAGDR